MCVHHMPLYDDIIHYVYITSLYFMIVYMSHAPHIFYQNGNATWELWLLSRFGKNYGADMCVHIFN